MDLAQAILASMGCVVGAPLLAITIAKMVDGCYDWRARRRWAKAERAREAWLEEERQREMMRLSPAHGEEVDWAEFRLVLARAHHERSVARALQRGYRTLVSQGGLDGSRTRFVALWDGMRGHWIRHSWTA